MPQRVTKTANEVLNYKFDLAPLTNGSGCSDWLVSGDTIAAGFTVTVDSGLNIHDGSTTYDGEVRAAPVLTDSSTSVTYWVSGGTASTVYKATLLGETSNGVKIERTMFIRVVGSK